MTFNRSPAFSFTFTSVFKHVKYWTHSSAMHLCTICLIKWAPKASWMVAVHPDICKCMCRIWNFLPTTVVLLCWCSAFSYVCFLPLLLLLPVPFLWGCKGAGAGLASRETHLQLIPNLSSYLNPPGTSPVCQMVASSASAVYFAFHLPSAVTLWLH